jgi:hypothetical protein
MGVLLALSPLLARDSTLSSHNKRILYKLMLRPIVTYVTPVWSNTSTTNYRHLQTLQSKCLQVVGNYPRRTTIHLLHSTLNIEPLHEFIHPLSGKFFHQCSIYQNPLVQQIGDYSIVDLQHRYKQYIHKRTKHFLLQFHPVVAVFFVYCVIFFTAVIFAMLNSPTCSCNDTVVNWFIKEQFCNLHVWFMYIGAISPFKNKHVTWAETTTVTNTRHFVTTKICHFTS